MSNEITFISDEDVVVIKNFAYIIDGETQKQSTMIENGGNQEETNMNNDTSKVIITVSRKNCRTTLYERSPCITEQHE